MKICVIGTGYVGLVAGTCFAEMGNEVTCVDKDKNKLAKLKKGIIPIYEPGLEELIISNVGQKRLFFTNDLNSAVESSEICFIAVGTPCNSEGCADLSAILDVAQSIAKSMNGYKIIVNKSTVPVGTAYKIKETIKKYTNFNFDVVSNPEFLKQGSAVEDFLKPERIIIGSDSQKALEVLQELYTPFVRTGNPIITMDSKSAEMAKYAANSFLALKISYINEIANICEKVGADIEKVRAGIASDHRIGTKFLFPGLGFGGSCLPKDIKALIDIAKNHDCDYRILKAAEDTNLNQKKIYLQKIINKFGENLEGKTFAVWGLSFKPKTNDMREAPSIFIIKNLLSYGAKIVAFDPKAVNTAKNIFQGKISYAKTAYDALKKADALLLLTEWNEFRHPDFDKIKKLLKQPVIFDGRNQYNKQELESMGFEYISK